MFNWYRELLEIRRENNRENELIETLKHEIEMLRHERDRLLNHALRTNEQTVTVNNETEYKPIPPRNVPWNVRRNMLEKEDRHQAKLMKDKNTTPLAAGGITTEDLEKELDIVEAERS